MFHFLCNWYMIAIRDIKWRKCHVPVTVSHKRISEDECLNNIVVSR